MEPPPGPRSNSLPAIPLDTSKILRRQRSISNNGAYVGSPLAGNITPRNAAAGSENSPRRSYTLESPRHNTDSPSRRGENKPVISYNFVIGLPDVSSFKIFYNRSLKTQIVTELKRCTVPPLTAEEINILVAEYCNEYVVRWLKKEFSNVTQIPAVELSNAESPRSKEIMKEIQCNGLLLRPFKKRLNIIETSIINFLEKEKSKNELLLRLICKIHALLAASTIEIFLKKFEESDDEVNDILKYIFGEIEYSRKEVLLALNCWNNPASYKLLQQNVRNACMNHIGIESITTLVHHWPAHEDEKNKLTTISTKDCLQTLWAKNGDASICESLKINDIEIDVKQMDQEDKRAGFFMDICSCIYFVLDQLRDKKYFGKLLEKLFAFESFHWTPLQEYFLETENPDFEEIKRRVNQEGSAWKSIVPFIYDEDRKQFLIKPPCPNLENCISTRHLDIIPILRLVSFNCWGHADKFIRTKFRGLFELLLWSSRDKGFSCEIHIKDMYKFHVVQTKTYRVYKKLHPEDKSNTSYDKNICLAAIKFRWTVFYENDSKVKIEGTLDIPEYTLNERISPEEKRMILNSLYLCEQDQDLEYASVVYSPH